jgi:hypothetical protein
MGMWRGEPVYKNVSAPATAGQALATFAAWVQLVTTSFPPISFYIYFQPQYCSLGVLFLKE